MTFIKVKIAILDVYRHSMDNCGSGASRQIVSAFPENLPTAVGTHML
jgi:hypothetical protein